MQGIESYFRELERCLDCPSRIRKPFLDKTRQMAKDFLQGKPEATPQELIDYLGEPQELAQGFGETLDPEMLERYQKKKKFIRWGLISLTVVVILLLGAWVYTLETQLLNVEIIETLIVER